MRILYLSSYYKPAFVYGGVVTAVAALCESLVKLGVKLTVLTTNANGEQCLDVPLGQPVVVDGVTVYYYPVVKGLPRTFFYSPDLAHAIDGMVGDCDLVVLDTFYTHPTGAAVRACLRTHTPYIVPLHGALLPWSLRQKSFKKQLYMFLLGRRYLNQAAALQCSDPVESTALKNMRLKAPFFVVPYGLDLAQWEKLPLRGTLRRQLDISETDRVLLMLGRLHRVKNPELAVDMLGLLQRADIHLVFVGPDEEGYGSILEPRAAALGCADRIHFTGLLTGEAILNAMADADLLVMPSVMESFGMAAIEAMVSGLPVLLSEYVPVGRWVEEAGAGRQVACTPEAFAVACQEMLDDDHTLKEMGRRARILATQRFDGSMVAKQMLAQYQAIVSYGQPLLNVHVQPTRGQL